MCMIEGTGNKRFENFRRIVKALHCPTRWLIIDCLKDGEKSTKEIFDCLAGKNEAISSSGLYYHLSELKNAGIIEIAGYIEQKGAPQKVWRLRIRKVEIPLLDEVEE